MNKCWLPWSQNVSATEKWADKEIGDNKWRYVWLFFEGGVSSRTPLSPWYRPKVGTTRRYQTKILHLLRHAWGMSKMYDGHQKGVAFLKYSDFIILQLSPLLSIWKIYNKEFWTQLYSSSAYLRPETSCRRIFHPSICLSARSLFVRPSTVSPSVCMSVRAK